jgi:CRISPR/Cas system CMR-associated protein Cmr5 small subunit
MKKYLIKYSLEFLVIVMGISVSFYLEEIRVANELKTLSVDLKQNLLDEISEIESYMIERELAFKGDQIVLNSLQDIKISYDSLLKISNIPFKYSVSLFNYRGLKPPVAFYNSLLNDGKIRYLESSSIKEELDKMHNVHYYYINENIKDEAVAQRKMIDFFQNNYPELLIKSIETNPNANYVKQIYSKVRGDIVLRSILFQKSLAIAEKVRGFNSYKESLQKLKNALLNDLNSN